MKTILAALACILPSCATTIWENGQKVAEIHSDATGFSYSRTPDGAVTMSAASLDNSTPIQAVGSLIRRP